MRKEPLVCLAASGGGHVRQLLDLEPFWHCRPHFLVTEDTALGRSLADRFDTSYVPHFALGQARLGAPFLMLRRALASMFSSFRIVSAKRPDLVVTTGAGSMLFIVLWARLFGAKVVLIDSFARFEGPSAFARLAGRFSHYRFAQSQAAARKWGDAQTVHPLRILDGPAPPKENLLFATVGATLPFERLTQWVLAARRDGHIPDRIVLQSGTGVQSAADGGVDHRDSLPFDEVMQLLSRARIVVCHGGTGSILTALQKHCHVIVIPRSFARGEHYDNHQWEIAESFAARGLVQVARDYAEFTAALDRVAERDAIGATTDYSESADRLDALFPPDASPS